jgi:hypothetical protein
MSSSKQGSRDLRHYIRIYRRGEDSGESFATRQFWLRCGQ